MHEKANRAAAAYRAVRQSAPVCGDNCYTPGNELDVYKRQVQLPVVLHHQYLEQNISLLNFLLLLRCV